MQVNKTLSKPPHTPAGGWVSGLGVVEAAKSGSLWLLGCDPRDSPGIRLRALRQLPARSNFSGRQDGLRGTGSRPPLPSPAPRGHEAPRPCSSLALGVGTARPPPPRSPRPRRCFVVASRRKRAPSTKRARGKPCTPGCDRSRGPSREPSLYLRVLSGGTEPCPEHRPPPSLAVPGQPDNGPGEERSPAGSGTSPPCFPPAPAPTSWRGTAGPGMARGAGGPRVGGSSPVPPGQARKCGQRYLRREFDLSPVA